MGQGLYADYQGHSYQVVKPTAFEAVAPDYERQCREWGRTGQDGGLFGSKPQS